MMLIKTWCCKQRTPKQRGLSDEEKYFSSFIRFLVKGNIRKKWSEKLVYTRAQ